MRPPSATSERAHDGGAGETPGAFHATGTPRAIAASKGASQNPVGCAIASFGGR